MLKKLSLFFVISSFFISQSAFSNHDFLGEPLENLELALLFCPEGVSKDECKQVTNNKVYHHYLVKDHSNLPPRVQDIARASVRFIIENDDYNLFKGPCTGTVVRLKKGNKSCGDQLHLLTAGHCMMWKEEGGFFPAKVTITTTADAVYPRHVLSFSENPRDLYKTCKAFYSHKKYSFKECLVDQGNFQSSRSADQPADQALVPFFPQNLPPSIKPLEIDIEKVASLEEVDMCLKNKNKTGYFSQVFTGMDVITFGLDYEDKTNLGSKVFQCKIYDDHNKPFYRKPIVFYKCPGLNGFSGALGYMKCDKKEALFLHVSQFVYSDNEKEGKRNLPVPYPSIPINGGLGNANGSVRLNPKLLEFYSEKVCGWEPPARPPAGAPPPAGVLYAKSNVNVRAAPGTAYTIIDRLSAGDAVTRLSLENGWYRVRLPNGNTGYVYAPLLLQAVQAPEPEMVVVPAGSFRMGDLQGDGISNERPVHTVSIRSFAVSKYEITVDQYAAFVADTNHTSPLPPGSFQGPTHPVVKVSWDDAKAYAGWLSGRTGKRYRLLTESEWEYAARAGTQTRYHFGNTDASLQRNANCDEELCADGFEHTSPVGSFQANGFGLHDMHGNVWEWVEDCWHNNYNGAPTDGSAWASGCNEFEGRHVLRGGSWSFNARDLRAAARGGSNRGLRLSTNGFRVAQDL